MTDLLAVTNAAAGSAEQNAVDAAVHTLRGRRPVEVVAASGPDDLDRSLRDHAGGRTVIVLGGDGSLHLVVACLHGLGMLADVTLGLIPLGTGNDFARSAGLPTDPEDAARRLLAAEPRPVDLLVDDDGGIVVNAVHLGLGAEAGVSAKRWKRVFGPLGYRIGAAVTGFTRRGMRVSVNVDGEPVRPRGTVLQVAIGNGGYVGAGAPLLPGADPRDGLLDVAVSFANPPLRRLAYAAHLRIGEHTKRDDVLYVSGTRVQVHGQPFRCNTDGEIGPLIPSRTWRIEPGAVSMLLPAETA